MRVDRGISGDARGIQSHLPYAGIQGSRTCAEGEMVLVLGLVLGPRC